MPYPSEIFSKYFCLALPSILFLPLVMLTTLENSYRFIFISSTFLLFTSIRSHPRSPMTDIPSDDYINQIKSNIIEFIRPLMKELM